MKIALYGATGVLGRRIAQEALSRGHQVLALSRDPSKLDLKNPQLTSARSDANDPADVARHVAGQDVVVSALGPDGNNPGSLVGLTRSLIDGVQRAGVRRLLMVGGAGSLEVAPGKQLVDAPEFPAGWKPIAFAHRDALEVLRQCPLEWTSLSPAALIQPGERTGRFRLGTEQLVVDAKGESRISAEDYAVALVDELEKPKHLRKRFTVAY
ncbi:NAD(P)-dependent oxidoreductase [Corallococcus sp. H22C18031201]|uniref:NAD(P)-dependent oxidoreductase n=1 Tax=Citreicoccus inhibens TaxID=2849499 RepID=UPI000E726433|nr:NAD(P)-dependent oxidoreductase [Citreicoccus inhibens]MBU8898681.1 NAD(P)-dependent oxidoreductase [Citreicoccus inhibens]RJS15954.1 NAD(P)-dependent oxidoreductase [Corallococcus sp. H22C18031201]